MKCEWKNSTTCKNKATVYAEEDGIKKWLCANHALIGNSQNMYFRKPSRLPSTLILVGLLASFIGLAVLIRQRAAANTACRRRGLQSPIERDWSGKVEDKAWAHLQNRPAANASR